MDNTQIKRLEKLAKHLEVGKLGHEIFDLNVVNTLPLRPPYNCGTSGCAMGELPIVFPKSWEFHGHQIRLIIPKVLMHRGLGYEICRWFGISYRERLHLFYANKQDPKLFGGSRLECSATREMVAANMRDFLRIKTS